MHRRGFTLIELLVVIAVIALLISVLLPALSESRALGIKTRCLASMRDIGTALAAYLTSNDDTFPLSQAHGGYQAGTAWIDTLMPQAASRLQYRCPADKSENFDVSNPAQRRVTSYGINVFMGPNDLDWTPDNDSGIPPRGHTKATRCGDTARRIFVCELAELNRQGMPIWPDHVHPDQWGVNPHTGYGGLEAKHEVAVERHLKRANYTFVDGHAEWLGFDETFRIDKSTGNKVLDLWDPGFPHGSPSGWFAPAG